MKHHYAREHMDILPDDHVSGNRDARVKLLEYGDFECPHCGAAYPVVKELQRTIGEDLCYIFRHFPLRIVHPHAENAAESAEAADSVGKFWQMHNLLFEHQGSLDDETLLQFGSVVGVDPDQLARDLMDQRYYPRVQRDVISGMRSGVNGTPTFFINGVRHNGGYQFSSLLAAIVAAGQLSMR
jgi:protein-disulfide isomerase